jgi:hypothetical protein
MAELLAKKKETKLLPSITNERLGYLEINEDKMRFKDAMKGGKAISGNEGMTLDALGQEMYLRRALVKLSLEYPSELGDCSVSALGP